MQRVPSSIHPSPFPSNARKCSFVRADNAFPSRLGQGKRTRNYYYYYSHRLHCHLLTFRGVVLAGRNVSESFRGEEERSGSREGGGGVRYFLQVSSLSVINRRFKKPSSAKRCINAFPSPPPLSFLTHPPHLALSTHTSHKVGEKKSWQKFHHFTFSRWWNSIINHFCTPPHPPLHRRDVTCLIGYDRHRFVVKHF